MYEIVAEFGENRASCFFYTFFYGHIIDEDRRKNAELFENAFYRGKSSDSEEKASAGGNNIQIPEGVDPEWISKVLANPEMLSLLMALGERTLTTMLQQELAAKYAI